MGVLSLLLSTILTVQGQCPRGAVCSPGNAPATNYVFGMGIYRVQLAGLDTTTNGVVDGYRDYSCGTGPTLLRGATHTLQVQTNPSADENVRAWLDFDNNGQFTAAELILVSNAARQHQGTFSIPASATTGQPLRLRIAADYSNAPIPTACSTSQYSQTEDYRVIVSASAPPRPVARFLALDTVSCGGELVFRDQSLHSPTTWQWDFGDNTSSLQQHPTHTYARPGTYAVRLRACNATGCDSLTKASYVTVRADAPTPAACTPATLAYCCGFGLTRLRLGTLDHTSADGSAGYQDFSCGYRATLIADRPAPLQLTTGPNAHDVRVYLDMNDNGQFDLPGELLYQGLSVQSPATMIQAPATAPGLVYHRPLRLRIWTDISGTTPFGPCMSPRQGQVEDYSVVVLPNAGAPAAQFAFTYSQWCGPTRVAVTNNTTGGATSYSWDFGDGTTSTAATPPLHTYATGGAYELTLVARNANGTDTLHQTVVVATNCPSYCQPTGNGGSNSVPAYFTRVQIGTLDNTDARGPGTGYRDFTARSVTLQQGQPYTVRAESLPFSFAGNGPWVRVSAWLDYNQDGTFALSERLGQVIMLSPYTMSFRVPLNARLGATRLRLQILYPPMRADLNASCYLDGPVSVEDYTVLIFPAKQAPQAGFRVNTTLACNGTVQFTDTTRAATNSWRWSFGDGTSSTQQHPQHTYTQPGTYSVTLEARNPYGVSTVTRPGYLTISSLNQGPRPAACLPVRGLDLDFNGQWEISSVEIGTWSYSNPQRLVDYRDETCTTPPIPLTAAATIPLAVRRPNYSTTTQVWVQAWLDANDDGVFDPIGERVYNSRTTNSLFNGPWTGALTLPANTLTGRALRLRLWIMLVDYQTTLAGYNLPCYRHEESGMVRDFTAVVGTVASTTGRANQAEEWTVFPNPSTGWVTIQTVRSQQTQAALYDSRGQRVRTIPLHLQAGQETKLNLGALPAGMYLLRLAGNAVGHRLLITP